MKPLTYPMSAPPKTSGIYALVNTRTGQVYIGQTVNFCRRKMEWGGVLNNKIGRMSKSFAVEIKDTDPTHWQFKIIAQAPAARLNQLEQRAIEHTRARIGDRCLNVDEPIKPIKVSKLGSMAKTKIIGPDGPMTYREAANHHGRTFEWARKRILKLRRRGIVELPVEQLLPTIFHRPRKAPA